MTDDQFAEIMQAIGNMDIALADIQSAIRELVDICKRESQGPNRN